MKKEKKDGEIEDGENMRSYLINIFHSEVIFMSHRCDAWCFLIKTGREKIS